MAHETRLHSLGRMTGLHDNVTQSPYDPLLEDPEDRYWGLSDRDVPILIGAAAGAIGLVFLIVGAIVIWYCCQFAFKSEKSIYSLDYESERGSVSSEATMPFSESTLFAGRSAKTADSSAGSSLIQDIKRSQSAPLNVNKLGLSSSRRKTGCGAPDVTPIQTRMYGKMVRGSEPMRDFEPLARLAPAVGGPTSRNLPVLVPPTPQRQANPQTRTAGRWPNPGASRSHLYSPSISQIVDSGSGREIFHLNVTSDSSWKSIEEADEMILEQDAGRSRQRGIHNPLTASLSRQQSLNQPQDTRSTDPQKVVVL